MNIPKKILLGIALLLVILIVAVLVWRGNLQTVQGNQNVVGNSIGGDATINFGSFK